MIPRQFQILYLKDADLSWYFDLIWADHWILPIRWKMYDHDRLVLIEVALTENIK